jgi:hypothetical protein
MQAKTILVPPEGVTILLRARPGAKSAEVVVVAPDDVEVSTQNEAISPPPERARPNAAASDARYIVERLRKLKVKTEAAAINSIKAMFQFTEPLTDEAAKKRLTEAQRKGFLKIDAVGKIVFRDT